MELYCQAEGHLPVMTDSTMTSTVPECTTDKPVVAVYKDTFLHEDDMSPLSPG